MTGMQPKYTVEKIAAVVGLAYRMQLLERVWFRWNHAQGRDCDPARAPPSRSQAARPNRRERKEQDNDSDLIGHDLEDLATASGPYTAFATAFHQRGRIR